MDHEKSMKEKKILKLLLQLIFGAILLFASYFYATYRTNHLNQVAHLRYFFVYYEVREKGASEVNEGDMWFESNGFPAKRALDSIVYAGLPRIRECYDPIYIRSFFEFKSKEDYDAFGRDYNSGYKRDGATPLFKKDSCCGPAFTNLKLTGLPGK